MYSELPFKGFTDKFLNLIDEAKQYGLQRIDYPPNFRPPASKDSPVIMIFSPHPDDEAIIGLLPLRLKRELNWRVINVAVTLGSKRERQKERYHEGRNSCNFLGFEHILPSQRGAFDSVNPGTRLHNPQVWEEYVDTISNLIMQEQPRVILIPHPDDGHVTHIGTYLLVTDALEKLGDNCQVFILESDYWHSLDNPNLMIEANSGDSDDLIYAISLNYGEVERNPYHLSHPSWFINNVRLGSEIINGKGSSALNFKLAILYRLRIWKEKNLEAFFEGGKCISQFDSLIDLFPSELLSEIHVVN